MESDNEKKGMEQAREFIKVENDEIIKFLNLETLDSENLKLLENMLNIYKDLLKSDMKINEMIAKNQKTQQNIFFFFAVLFLAEIIYSWLIGSDYIEPIKIKVLMMVFIFFLIYRAYSVFRK